MLERTRKCPKEIYPQRYQSQKGSMRKLRFRQSDISGKMPDISKLRIIKMRIRINL